jgi:F-type H+-transporting ATPase subunit b
VIPDLSVLWVILFVLLLTAIVHQLLFRPLLRVVNAREGSVQQARGLAVAAEQRAAAASAEYDAQISAARGEVYRQMETTRRSALERRTELLTLTRQEADDQRADAARRLSEATAQARVSLSAEAEALSHAIVERVLDRKRS